MVETNKGSVKHNHSSILGTCFNLTNSIVGAGIVGIPYAIKESGFLCGILLILFAALLTEKSLRMLISTAKTIQVTSYEELCEVCFGRPGYVFVSFCMLIMAYGGMVSYLMILRDIFPMIFGITDFVEKRVTLLCISLFVIFPLSSQKDMADLAKTSCLNIFFDIGLVSCITFIAWKMNHTAVESEITKNMELSSVLNESMMHPQTIFIGIGILSFAFSCQHASFIVANSLYNPTSQRWSKVTCMTLTICGSLSLLMGISGYMAFRHTTDGNVLNNLSSVENDHPTLVTLARIAMSVVMCFVYPVECFVARHVMSTYIYNIDENDTTKEMTMGQRLGLTFVLYLLSIVPACLIDELGGVLAITGTIGGSCLAYIAPGLTYLAVYGTDFLELSSRCSTFLYYLTLMPLWNFIIHHSLLVQSELGSTYNNKNIDEKVLEMTNLKINVEINGEDNSQLLDIALVEPDALAFSYNSRRCGEGVAPRSHWDFIVAIGFIIFGIVAIVAGVYSEFKVQTGAARRLLF